MSEEASYKQKLEVLQQQQELIEDEAEQEQEEQEARKAELEAKKAEEAARKEQEDAAKQFAAEAEKLAGTEGMVAEEKKPEKAEDDARMTKEQLGELAEALNILTAKSSIIKEREELKAILEDNLLSEAVSGFTISFPQSADRNRNPRSVPTRRTRRSSPCRSASDR